ncbi:MAG: type II toxin-antitoxin system VapC family toxin [Planctomycetaceae bacterium]
MSSVIFDASAVLAVLNRETGHEKAAESIYGAAISAVNYGEVLKKSAERGGSISHVAAILRQQRMQVTPFDAEQAVQAAEIWWECKPLGLSFADRACIALGLTLKVPIITAEQSMSQVELPVEFQLIRHRGAA